MIRQIIRIDQEKCDGCGLCVLACHEAAIAVIDGKARLLHDKYCDGLGNCLPVCPSGAISFEEREAVAYDEAAVEANLKSRQHETDGKVACGCPSAEPEMLRHKGGGEEACGCLSADSKTITQCDDSKKPELPVAVESQLRQWPVQIKLVAYDAPFFHNAGVLIAADCAAYVYGNFHQDYMKDRITLIGCPKLDDVDYSQKLTAYFQRNTISSITVVRIEVPCCGGIVSAVKTALQKSGKSIPLQVVTMSIDGKILPD